MNEAELIERSWTHPETFAQVFELHFSGIFAFCARRVGPVLAEDMAGETFRRAFEQRLRYDLSRSSSRPWLMGIALNVIRNELRRQNREMRAFERAAAGGFTGEGLDERAIVASLDMHEDLARAHAALNQLPVTEAEAMMLFAWDQQSYDQIAEITGVPLGTVRSRIHSARRRLAEMLDQSAGASSASPPCSRR